MQVNTNVSALNAWRYLSGTDNALSKNLERLSSGYRINKAADDAAGLAVSEKMRSQIRGIQMAVRNTQDAVSMLQTAEGGASKIQDMLQRMRELAVQASSDTLQDTDRAKLNEEFTALRSEVDRTATTTTFNNRKLIDGSSGDAATLNSGNEIKNVQVTGALKGAGLFTINTTQVAREETYKSAGAFQKDGTTAVTWDDTATVDAQFGGTAFTTGDNLKLDQDGKSITIDLNATKTLTVAEFVNYVNDKANTAGMALRMKYQADGAAAQGTGLAIESNIDGTYGDVTVTETTAGSATFGIAVGTGGSDPSVDATFTVTDSTTNLTLAAGTAYTIKGNTLTGASGYGLQGVKFDAAQTGGVDGSLQLTQNSIAFQVGANSGETISANIGKLTGSALGVSSSVIDSKSAADSALASLDTALSTLSTERAKMGAIQNRLDNAQSVLQVQAENLTAAEGRIRDVDMAAEMTQFQKSQILMQAGTAMLAQANSKNQAILQLLRG